MVPRQSRNLHENGFRHINAKERHLRQIYKSGAEKKKAAELETREMERIERVRPLLCPWSASPLDQ
jgi:hypothetical protein